MAETNPRSAGRSADNASYSAVITLGGSRLVFESEAGEDLGTYEGEHVRQRCIRVMRKDTALTVHFRPDAELARLEVVVELGRVWLDGTGIEPAHLLSGYSCEILRNGKPVATVKVPVHWWWSRWRWQSAARPVVRKPAELIRKKLLAPYGRTGLYGAPVTARAVPWQGPMDTAGLATAMSSPGDRPEIGLLTEYQADFVISGTPAALTSLLSQGEACGSMPIHWRDEHTGAMVDVYQYPALSADAGGSPRLPYVPEPSVPPGLPGAGRKDPRYFGVEQSHTPPAAYVPYILTDDPYYLEELEALATMAICRSSFHRRSRRLPGLVYPGETRAFAWSVRSLFELGAVAPANPPKWLRDRDYWRRCVADNLTYMRLFMASPARVHKVFRAFTRPDMISGWQNSYVALVLGMGVRLGYEDWREAYLWFLHSVTQLCNGKSGWNRQWPAPYYFHPIQTWKKTGSMTLVPDTHLDDVTDASWADAWRGFKDENKIDDTGWDGHTLMQNQSGPIYYLYLRACLAMATHFGVPEAKDCYNFIAAELPASLQHFKVPGNARWSIDPA
jgi:hypothetical protein